MPEFGCYKMLDSSPERIWKADYIAHKAGQVEFWKLSSDGGKDILVAVAQLERGQTISEVTLTEVSKVAPSIYQAVFDREKPEPVYDYLTGRPVATLLAAPSE